MLRGETASKCFAHEHSTELLLLDRESMRGLNWILDEQDFERIVGQYDSQLSPLRKRLMVELLWHRYQRVRKFVDV